jgi:hemoglobin
MEQTITQCVQKFYEKAREDPVLGPVFISEENNQKERIEIVRDFWLQAVFGADRRQGEPYPLRQQVALTHDHFRCWLDIFAETAREALPAAKAEEAIAKATRVSDGFQARLTPVVHRERIVVCRPA